MAVVLGELDITTDYDCLITEDECSANGELGRKCLKEKRCADKSKKYEMLSTKVHEKYALAGRKPRQYSLFDIAIITMATPVTFSAYIQPVCLPDPARLQPSDQPRPLVLTGWGNTAPG